MLFVLYYTYGQRKKIKLQKEKGIYQKQSLLSFFIGIIILSFYLLLFYITSYFYLANNARRILLNVTMMLLYALYHSLIAKAFMLMSMIEYYRKNTK